MSCRITDCPEGCASTTYVRKLTIANLGKFLLEPASYEVRARRLDSRQKMTHRTRAGALHVCQRHRAVLLAAVLASLAAQSAAKTWFVNASDPAATDGPSGGSAATPFKTLKPATAAAFPGDVVLVGRGVYRERVAPARSGTADQPIVYMAALGEQVYLKGSAVLDWNAVGDGTYK